MSSKNTFLEMFPKSIAPAETLNGALKVSLPHLANLIMDYTTVKDMCMCWDGGGQIYFQWQKVYNTEKCYIQEKNDPDCIP